MNKETLDTLIGQLEFEMNFKTIKKLDERFGHLGAIEIFDSMVNFNGPNFTDSTLKVLECCCTSKALKVGELEELLKPSLQNIRKIDEIACKLVLGFLGENDDEVKGEKTEKN